MQPPEGRIAILSAGLNLRGVRERLGLTMREVESAASASPNGTETTSSKFARAACPH